MIATWWAGLSAAMKVLWGVTLGASLIFIIQTVLTFLGADSDATGLDGGDIDVSGSFDAADATDADLGGGGNLYTFRNLVNFLLGFGWSVILLEDAIPSVGLRLVVAVAIA